MRYDSASWSVDCPNGWDVDADEYCVSFTDPSGFGALQISAAKKLEGPVTSNDLLRQAQKREAANGDLLSCSFGPFNGFTKQYSRENNSWREFWLSSGQTFLYITYVCAVEDNGKELEAVNRILDSIQAPEPSSN